MFIVACMPTDANQVRAFVFGACLDAQVDFLSVLLAVNSA
jgi:hypothetical protein